MSHPFQSGVGGGTVMSHSKGGGQGRRVLHQSQRRGGGRGQIMLMCTPSVCLTTPMLWVCDHYVYYYSYSAGIDFNRQNLGSTDVRF